MKAPATPQQRDASLRTPIVKLVFLRSSRHEPLIAAVNANLDEVPDLLERVRALGVPVESVDTSPWGQDQLTDAYLRAVTPAVVRHSKQYSVRRAFGTRRKSGSFFAREVPVLLVLAEGNVIVDVYPHYEADRPVTIRDFLRHTLADPTSLYGGRRTFSAGDVARLRELRRSLKVRFTDDSVALIRAMREGR